MSRRSARRSRRPFVQWRGAIPLALLTAVLGYVAVTDSLAQALRKKAPAQAHALAPSDGRSTAALAEKLAGAGATAARRAESDRLALLALRQDPTAVDAVATLGLNARLRGDAKAAARYFTYSDKLSRRDLKTRIWLIEDAARRGDVDGALRNYDIALRTSRLAPDVLLPVLVRASSEPVVAKALVRTLATKPLWTDAFLYALASGSQKPQAMATLLVELRKAGVKPSEPSVDAIAVARLLAANAYEPAWSFYRELRRNVDRRQSRDPRFALDTPAPTAFDWVPTSDNSGITAAILRGERGGVFDFAAPPSVGGLLLQQLQLLPPGQYLLTGRSSGIEQDRGARPYWVLACGDGKEVGRLDLPNSAENGGVFRGRFTVPAGCPAQYLRLMARSSSAVNGLSGQIVEARLVPAG